MSAGERYVNLPTSSCERFDYREAFRSANV